MINPEQGQPECVRLDQLYFKLGKKYSILVLYYNLGIHVLFLLRNKHACFPRLTNTVQVQPERVRSVWRAEEEMAQAQDHGSPRLGDLPLRPAPRRLGSTPPPFHIMTPLTPFQNGTKGPDSRCVLHPNTSGKAHLESRIKSVNPISFMFGFSGGRVRRLRDQPFLQSPNPEGAAPAAVAGLQAGPQLLVVRGFVP